MWWRVRSCTLKHIWKHLTSVSWKYFLNYKLWIIVQRLESRVLYWSAASVMNSQLDSWRAAGESVLCLIEPDLFVSQCADETFSRTERDTGASSWSQQQREAWKEKKWRLRNWMYGSMTWKAKRGFREGGWRTLEGCGCWEHFSRKSVRKTELITSRKKEMKGKKRE